MSHKHDHDHKHNGHQCDCSQPAPMSQTLDELEFERGLWGAARDGNDEKVEQLLNQKKDPNIRDPSGYTALMYAARAGSLKCCKLLLQSGANPNIVTDSGRATPLHRAAFCGHKEVVEVLIQYKADVNIADDDGCTPLHKAAQQGHLPAVEALLLHGAKKELQDKKGKTAADLAKERGHQQIERVLLFFEEMSYGVDPKLMIGKTYWDSKFEPWCRTIPTIELDDAYDLVSEFICLRSRFVSPIFKKNPNKYFKFLGFCDDVIMDLLPHTKKFKHLSYLQIALNFARSQLLRKRKYRCQTDLDCWKLLQLEEPKPRLYIAENKLEETKPLQTHVYNCANFASLSAHLDQLRKMAQKEKKQLLFHGTTWTKATAIAKGINIDCALPHSEFSVNSAFYVTNDWHQAHLHAMSKTAIYGYDDPAVVLYYVPEGYFDKRQEHVKLQDDPDLWQTIVQRCRNPTDTDWKDRWEEFVNDFDSLEGPVPAPEDSDPTADPKPKRNSWQLAVINDKGAARLDKTIVGIVVWGDYPFVTPQPVVTAPHLANFVHEPKNPVTEVTDIDMLEQISPISTPKKISVN